MCYVVFAICCRSVILTLMFVLCTCRAISVLLGAMWKSLPEEDRETFNAEARAQAEERKRIDPDCWKRKRSHSTS